MKLPTSDCPVRLLHGDCVDVLDSVADNTFDSVVTDPPYGLEFMDDDLGGSDGFRRMDNPSDTGRDSVFGRTSRRAPEYRTVGTGRRDRPGIGDRKTEWVSHQGWNQFRCGNCGHLFHGGSPCDCDSPYPVRADNRWPLFQQWCAGWSAVVLRVLKPGGYMLAMGGTRTYHRLACAIEDVGFEIRDCLMWLYGVGMPKHDACLKPSYEPILLCRKPGRYSTPLFVDADVAPGGRHPANVIHDGECLFPLGDRSRYFYSAKVSADERGGSTHPTMKPLSLVRWMVRLVTPAGGLVLDPFAGSGTTPLACRDQGFRCVAVEKDAEYFQIMKTRLT